MTLKRKIGIMGAIPEEIAGVSDLLSDRSTETIGMRSYHSGFINQIPTVVVFSRWGKVAAAATASILIERYGITELIFTGVAGGLHAELKIGDVVLGKRLIQHDMDARPLMNRFEVPLLAKTFFEADPMHINLASLAINELFGAKGLHQVFANDTLEKFNISNPTLWVGDVASGDQFFSKNIQRTALHAELPSILCVEMEGAAVAQVCYEHQIPFTIIRTISDAADENAHVDFPSFIKHIASKYAAEIVKNIYRKF